MTEPKRWLEEGAPGGVGALLRAGLEERPSERVLQRTLIAVGTTAVATSATTGAIGAAAKLVMAAKVTTISIATASALLGAGATVQYLRTTDSAPVPNAVKRVQQRHGARQSARTTGNAAWSDAAPEASITPEIPSAPAPRGLSEVATESHASGSVAPSGNVAPSPDRSHSVAKLTHSSAAPSQIDPSRSDPVQGDPTRNPQSESTNRDGPSATRTLPFVPATESSAIHEEIAAIDVARAYLHAGNTGGALRALDEYDRRTDFGRFAPEALYLRMQAQLRAGQTNLARATAQELVRRFPRSAQVGRARQVLESASQESTRPVQIH